jgi:hypothetical protein
VIAESLTSRVVAGRQEDATSRLPYPDDVAGSWGAENAILSDQKLLDSVCGTDFGDELRDFGIPVTTVTTDDQERALDALGDRLEDAGNESLRVVLLLENLDLLAQARTSRELENVDN